MKSIKTALLFLLSSLVILSACKQNTTLKEDALISIPADVNSVTAINPEQLLAKADFENFKKQELFQKMMKDAKKENPALAEILSNPEESGIDLSKNIYINFELSAENMRESFTYGIASLKDKAKFEAMIANANLSDIETSEQCKLILQKGNIVLAWNDKNALIGMSSIYNGDSKAWAKKVFSTTEETSVANNENLQKVLETKHDIVSWNNMTSLANNPQVVMMAGMINIAEEDLKDNYIHSYADFEKGAILGKSIFTLKKGLTKDFDLLFNNKVKTDFKAFFPGKDLAFVSTVALNWRGLNQVLSEQIASKSMIDRYLKEFGTNLNELTKILQGDIAIAVYGHEEGQEEKALFAAPIADKELLQKALDLAISYEMIEKVDEQNYLLKSRKFNSMMPRSGGVHIGNAQGKLLLKDDMIFISSNDALLDQLRDGSIASGDRIDSDKWNSLTGNIFGGFVDFKTIGKFTKSEDLKDLETMNINTNRKTADFRLDLEDKSINSLKLMLQKLNDAYKKDQLKIEIDPEEESKKAI